MRLQKKDNHGENMANVAYLYSQHLYSKVDPSLNQTQKNAISLYTAKSILKSGGEEALQALSEKFYEPMIVDDGNIQELLNRLEVIDSKGLFFSVLIQEMVFLGNKILFRPNAEGIHDEVTRFVTVLVNFANRVRGDDSIQMDFRGANIKVSFVLVALREKRDANETESYVRRVRDLLPRDTESFYLMGWGENVAFVRKVAEVVCANVDRLEMKKEKGYERSFEDGRIVDAICVLVRNRRIANFIEPTRVAGRPRYASP